MKKLFLILCLLFLAGFVSAANHQITQTSTINALHGGAYSGQMSCGDLLKYGDTGVGTFDRYDGEMVILNGKVYQIKANGKVYRPGLYIKTPYAVICGFESDKQFDIKSADFNSTASLIDKNYQNQNVFLAVKIIGEFKHIKVHSVAAQQKPYPPITEVAKHRPVFEANDIKGTIVGFRTPVYAKNFSAPGYHFHFISDDFTFGGHVLEFEIRKCVCKIEKCDKFLFLLPNADLVKDIDLSKDKLEELKKAEK